ncbi:MAG: lipoprotein [Pseudomonas sp.]|jgi:hypothetical protein|uniref:DUF4136 domain-containing protein n=1 Tax=Pseudomonas sp. TaxID=306 RepID=UPI00260B266E|nr:DUF4136 domain-containing protein [Pseudomonas sp.]MDB6048440.1 lipoprotein [Pseudomonas sp.]
MLRGLAILSFALLLSACETNRVNRDFDATRDFGAYRSWSWQEPGLQYQPDDPRIKSDLTEQRIRQSVSDQLDQRGLRMAAPGSRADVKVQVYLIIEDRQQMISTNYGGGPWGGGWGRGWGGWGGMSETRNVDYKVSTLQIDLLDGKDGKLVWRGSTEQVINTSQITPAARDAAIHQTVAKVLEQYPPH